MKKAKKRLSNLGLHDLSADTKRIVNDLQLEEDRGAVLVGVAFLDDVLDALLRAVLIDDSRTVDKLLKYPGPVCTFAARCDLAYSMGLLNAKMYSDLRIMRKIRNEFAHSHRPVRFTQAKIENRCRELSPIPWKKLKLDWNPSPRSDFIVAVACLLSRLILLGLKKKHAKVGKGFA